jgi:hypothetical protein
VLKITQCTGRCIEKAGGTQRDREEEGRWNIKGRKSPDVPEDV